jgi:hypothetical protein
VVGEAVAVEQQRRGAAVGRVLVHQRRGWLAGVGGGYRDVRWPGRQFDARDEAAGGARRCVLDPHRHRHGLAVDRHRDVVDFVGPDGSHLADDGVVGRPIAEGVGAFDDGDVGGGAFVHHVQGGLGVIPGALVVSDGDSGLWRPRADVLGLLERPPRLPNVGAGAAFVERPVGCVQLVVDAFGVLGGLPGECVAGDQQVRRDVRPALCGWRRHLFGVVEI